MRVKMVFDISGTHDGEEWPARGSEVDLEDSLALDLIRNGAAKPAGDKPVEVAADVAPVETAVAVAVTAPKDATFLGKDSGL